MQIFALPWTRAEERSPCYCWIFWLMQKQADHEVKSWIKALTLAVDWPNPCIAIKVSLLWTLSGWRLSSFAHLENAWAILLLPSLASALLASLWTLHTSTRSYVTFVWISCTVVLSLLKSIWQSESCLSCIERDWLQDGSQTQLLFPSQMDICHGSTDSNLYWKEKDRFFMHCSPEMRQCLPCSNFDLYILSWHLTLWRLTCCIGFTGNATKAHSPITQPGHFFFLQRHCLLHCKQLFA